MVLTNVDAHALVKGNVERNGLVTDCLNDGGGCRGDEMRATIGQERHGIALAAKGSHCVGRQFLGRRIALEDGRCARVDTHVCNWYMWRPGHFKGQNALLGCYENVVLVAQRLEMGNVRLQLALHVSSLQNDPPVVKRLCKVDHHGHALEELVHFFLHHHYLEGTVGVEESLDAGHDCLDCGILDGRGHVELARENCLFRKMRRSGLAHF